MVRVRFGAKHAFPKEWPWSSGCSYRSIQSHPRIAGSTRRLKRRRGANNKKGIAVVNTHPPASRTLISSMSKQHWQGYDHGTRVGRLPRATVRVQRPLAWTLRQCAVVICSISSTVRALIWGGIQVAYEREGFPRRKLR